jgi:single-stranded-DNA-specific exonuclease
MTGFFITKMIKLELRKPDIDEKIIDQISKEMNLDTAFVRILLGRGLDTKDKINSFIYDTLDDLTDPFLYSGMESCVIRISEAITNNEKILIYGDYDCDGIGASAILYLALKKKGIIPDYYIPTRFNEGYGLNFSAIDKIKKDFDPDLIITVDLGITAVEEVNYIKSLGIDIIITDHHKLGEEVPDCIIVNPCLNPNLTSLCGAGVAFMVVLALMGTDVAYEYLDICAISTIADIVPLIGDNRIIVKYGMANIKKGKCRTGIKLLLFAIGVNLPEINTYDISFKIAPRLNASGRLNSAYSSLSLLIEDDLTAISMLTEELEMDNSERQNLNAEILKEAREIIKSYDLYNNKIIVLQKDDWNEGVIGIVASKIVEEFHKPTILFTLSKDGSYKGSARSISSVNIHEVLSNCKKHLKGFGGHAMAAGLSIEKSSYNDFIKDANLYILSNYPNDMEKTIKFDAELPIKAFTSKFFDSLRLLEPYGQGNSKPLFLDSSLQTKFKRINKTNHIKMRTRLGDLLYFNGYPQIDYYNEFIHKIVYSADLNFFNGQVYKQFKVKEIIASGEIPSESILIKRYLKTFVRKYYKTKEIALARTGEIPILYVTFNSQTYKDFTKKYYDINKYVFSTSEINGKDSIVLSPDNNFPFEYYHKIVVLNTVSNTYLEFLKSKVNNVIIENLSDFKIEISIESLREDYVFFYRNIGKAYKFVSEEEMYQFLVSFGYLKSYIEFLAAFYTFIDVELLISGNNDILSVNNNKVDLLESAVFKYLSREK